MSLCRKSFSTKIARFSRGWAGVGVLLWAQARCAEVKEISGFKVLSSSLFLSSHSCCNFLFTDESTPQMPLRNGNKSLNSYHILPLFVMAGSSFDGQADVFKCAYLGEVFT